MIQLLCVLGVDIDTEFIPHHMAYYAARGVTLFRYILHANKSSKQKVNEIEVQLRDIASSLQVEMPIPKRWRAEFHSQTKLKYLLAAIKQHAVKHEPFLVVDMDEYLMTDDIAKTFKNHPHGACIYGLFYDAFAADYPCIADVLSDVPILEQFPYHRENYAQSMGCGYPIKPVIIRNANFGLQHKHPDYTVKAFQQRYKKLLPIVHVRWTTSRMAKSVIRQAAFKKHGAAHWVLSARAVAVLKTLPIYERNSDGNDGA